MGTEIAAVVLTIAGVIALSYPLGQYMARVFSGQSTWLDPVLLPIEKAVLAATGVDPAEQQDWKAYGRSILCSNLVMWLATFAIVTLQGALFLNPDGIAAMEPTRRVVLVEPMERRTTWLREASEELGLSNVTVLRGRAEEVRDVVEADVVTARAVASIDKLVKWSAPLLSPNGRMALLKGRSAAEELDKAKYVLRKAGLVGEVKSAPTVAGLEATATSRGPIDRPNGPPRTRRPALTEARPRHLGFRSEVVDDGRSSDIARGSFNTRRLRAARHRD